MGVDDCDIGDVVSDNQLFSVVSPFGLEALPVADSEVGSSGRLVPQRGQ